MSNIYFLKKKKKEPFPSKQTNVSLAKSMKGYTERVRANSFGLVLLKGYLQVILYTRSSDFIF